MISFSLIGYDIADSFFVSDWWIMVNMAVFAFTNGYFSTLAMIYGPNDFQHQPEVAGKIMAFYLTFGIFMGTVIAQVVMARFVPEMASKMSALS